MITGEERRCQGRRGEGVARDIITLGDEISLLTLVFFFKPLVP